MAPNRRGSAPQDQGSVIKRAEVEARGRGTKEDGDSWDPDRRLWSEYRVFFTGVMFLTRLPCPSWTDHHPAFLMRSMMWFPLLGAMVGGWAAAFYAAAALLWSPAVAAGLSTLASVWLTGCFHEDGLADTFDGFGGGWGKTQILRIMKDSRIGTYALVGMLLVLHVKMHALEAITEAFGIGGTVRALVVAHTISRWSALPLIYWCHYLQDEEDAKRGLYNHFADSKLLLTLPRMLLGTLVAVAVPFCLLTTQQAIVVCSVVGAVTVASGMYGNAIIGGVMGDYLGATISIAELLVYAVLSANWSKLDSIESCKPLLVLAAVAALPILYSRRIVDFKGAY